MDEMEGWAGWIWMGIGKTDGGKIMKEKEKIEAVNSTCQIELMVVNPTLHMQKKVSNVKWTSELIPKK